MFPKPFPVLELLLFDSGSEEQRILIIFSTRKNLEYMQRCEHWYADGTFKTNPLLFAQMYTIHAVQYSNVIPTVYALLPNKTEYNRLFSALKNLQPGLQPTSVLVDFEKAAMNASQTQFPNAKIRGRFFTLHNVFGDRFKSMAYKADTQRIPLLPYNRQSYLLLLLFRKM